MEKVEKVVIVDDETDEVLAEYDLDVDQLERLILPDMLEIKIHLKCANCDHEITQSIGFTEGDLLKFVRLIREAKAKREATMKETIDFQSGK